MEDFQDGVTDPERGSRTADQRLRVTYGRLRRAAGAANLAGTFVKPPSPHWRHAHDPSCDLADRLRADPRPDLQALGQHQPGAGSRPARRAQEPDRKSVV